MDTLAGLDDARLRVDSVTGVPLELSVAGPGGRSFAFIIDFHIRVLAALTWYFGGMLLVPLVFDGSTYGPAIMLWALQVPAALIYLLYHPVLEIVMAGRTPGKRIAGVRIVTTDGSVPGAGSILLRNVFRYVDGLPALYVVGLVTSVVSARNQRIGDIAARTLLIYDEASKGDDVGDVSSAGAARGISTAQAELVQDLVDRWPTLDVDDRLDLARRLLARLDPDRGGAQGAMLNDDNALRALQGYLGGLR
ncbi:MAG TPA: RDD family protein [Steroidobacteraceae bacterium]|nr:RDD family protein [Steroidobacteraceae bacterium]